MSEITLGLWGVSNLIMAAVNFDKAKVKKHSDQAAFHRALMNILPGQVMRFFFLPPQEEVYFIPAGIGLVATIVFYLYSAGAAIAQIVFIWQDQLESGEDLRLITP